MTEREEHLQLRFERIIDDVLKLKDPDDYRNEKM
jgi:hypothetical protein